MFVGSLSTSRPGVYDGVTDVCRGKKAGREVRTIKFLSLVIVTHLEVAQCEIIETFSSPRWLCTV